MEKRKKRRKLPTISIITPSYNQGQFIEQTINSVLSQEYPYLEYIVMDGGSTDCTVEILRKHRHQLKFFSEKDKGQSHAINKGLKMTTGQIIGYLNSDDLLEPGTLREIGEYFQNHPEIYWVTGKCQVIDEKGKLIHSFITSYKNFWLKYLRTRKVLIILNYISQPATFWKREAVERIGFFNQSLYYTMDYDYWLRLSKIYKLGFIDKYLASFRIHEGSKTAKNIKGLFNEGCQVARQYSKLPIIFLHKLHDILAILIYKLF